MNSLDEEDYAFDFEIRPTGILENSHEVGPAPFFVQLKASERFDDDETVWWDLDTEFTQDDCLQASIPVVLVVYERHSDEFYWRVIQRYCWDTLDEEREDWRNQSTVRVRIPRDPLTVRGPNHDLRTAVEETQRRITARSYVAMANRTSFEHPPGTTLASSDEVTEHKAELVEEIRVLVDADHLQRALEKAMRVYQLPEEDEPTRDAILFLLDLRQMDDPAAAFARQRLARQGLRLAEIYDRPEVYDALEDTYETAWRYIEETFIGSTYYDSCSQRDLLVLDVRQWVDRGDDEPIWVAPIQYGVGELGEDDARSNASNDQYELVEPGNEYHPLDEACDERSHGFPADDLREFPLLAICETCGLSRDTIDQLLNHDVPSVCDECDSIVYETVSEPPDVLCTDCVA